MLKQKEYDAIFLQDANEDIGESTWCADKIYDTDIKYISLEKIKELCAPIITGKGLTIPRASIAALMIDLDAL